MLIISYSAHATPEMKNHVRELGKGGGAVRGPLLFQALARLGGTKDELTPLLNVLKDEKLDEDAWSAANTLGDLASLGDAVGLELVKEAVNARPHQTT